MPMLGETSSIAFYLAGFGWQSIPRSGGLKQRCISKEKVFTAISVEVVPEHSIVGPNVWLQAIFGLHMQKKHPIAYSLFLNWPQQIHINKLFIHEEVFFI